MSYSLSRRLIVTSAVASGAVILLMGVGLYIAVAHILRVQFDHVLLAQATAIAAGVDWDNSNGLLKVRLESDAPLPQRHQPGHEQSWAFIWTSDGRLMYRSTHRFVPQKPQVQTYPAFATEMLPHQQRVREVLVPLQVDDSDGADGASNHAVGGAARNAGAQAVLAVVQPLDSLDDTLQALLMAVAVSGGLATVVLAVVLVVIARSSLRPLRDLELDIARAGAPNLAHRVAVPHAPSELEPVVNRLNDLLARLQSAFERERALTADIAHELRTPLAGICTTLELSLTRPRDEASYRQTMECSLDIAHRMQTMMANLLMLTRAEAGQMRLAGESFDIGRCAGDVLNEHRAALGEKDVRMTMAIEPQCGVNTDRTAAELVLRNVADNAANYVNAGGIIELSVQRSGKSVLVKLANSGSQVSAADTSHVFERFWRSDAARTGDGSHCGLGLALVQRLMAVLGGSVQVRSEQGGRFEIELMFRDLGVV